MLQQDNEIFFDGEEVSSLWWSDGSNVTVGQSNVEKITVAMQPGQMAMVPWFAVWQHGKIAFMHNGAHISSVNLQNTA